MCCPLYDIGYIVIKISNSYFVPQGAVSEWHLTIDSLGTKCTRKCSKLRNSKSRLELLDATKRLLEEVSEKKKGLNLDDLDEEIVNQSLYLSSTPQLLIRTSGEVRLSDFLLSE